MNVTKIVSFMSQWRVVIHVKSPFAVDAPRCGVVVNVMTKHVRAVAEIGE